MCLPCQDLPIHNPKVLLLPGKHSGITMTNSSQKFGIGVPLGAWCFSYDVKTLLSCIVSMYCAYL